MPLIAVVALFVLLGILSLFGWGTIALRVLRHQRPPSSLTVGLGLGVFLFLGGVLNLARAATPVALDLLTLTGVGVGVLELCARWWKGSARASAGERVTQARRLRGHDVAFACGRLGPALLLALFAASVVVFVTWTQVPPSSVNPHDDLQKYLAHPVRMLTTGTLLGSPLSAVGSETLGGQAFLHAVIISHAPLLSLHALDALFGLLLCLLLAFGAASRTFAGVRGSGGATTLCSFLALAAVVTIHPQAVNVASLYTGAALISTLVLLPVSSAPAASDGHALAPAVLLGLVYAGLVALKATFLLFVVAHLLALMIAASCSEGWRRAGRNAAHVLVTTVACIAPWLLTHLPNYLGALTASSAGFGMVTDERDTSTSLTRLGALARAPFSIDWSGESYGAPLLGYLVTVLLVGLTALILCPRARSHPAASPERTQARALIALGAALVASFAATLLMLAPELPDPKTALRYFAPVAVGAAPAWLALCQRWLARERGRIEAARTAEPGARLLGANPSARIIAHAPLLALLIVVGVFLPSLMARVTWAQRYRTGLPLADAETARGYAVHTAAMLSEERAQLVRGLQALVPDSERLLAWIDSPFDLDFSRNEVCDIDIAGLATAWAELPQARYILWEYDGFGVRSRAQYQKLMATTGRRERRIAHAGLSLAELFAGWARRAKAAEPGFELLFDDGHLLLMRIGPEAPARVHPAPG